MMFAYFRVYRNYPTVSFFVYYSDYFLGMGKRPADWSGPAWPDVNFGHLWFVEHLVLYGVVYSLFRLVTKKREINNGPARNRRELFFPSTARIGFFAVLLCAVTFAIRVKYPLYAWIGLFGFLQIEPAHIAFYLSMFFIGIVAYRNDWLAQLPGKTGKLWSVIGLASATVIALLPVEGKYFGGLNAYSFAYALFESFSCLGLIIGLLYQFWRYCNSQSALMEALARNSYLVYILHLPIVVLYQYLFSFARIDPYLKFAVVSILAIPSTVCVSYLARKIPFVAKYI
jgi:glucans biosynthesis protein C